MILDEELRYDYGSGDAWRFKRNWSMKDDGLWYYFNLDEVVEELKPEDSKCWEDENWEDLPKLFTTKLGSKTIVGDDISIQHIPFSSHKNVSRDGLPDFETGCKTVAFPDFPDAPLGIPVSYLKTPMDGSCFYSSLSWALYGSTTAAGEIRNFVCDYVRDHFDMFEDCFGQEDIDAPGSHQQVLDKQRKAKTYTDYVFVLAAARAFDINIVIFMECYWQVIAPEVLGTRGNVYIRLKKEHYRLVTAQLLAPQLAPTDGGSSSIPEEYFSTTSSFYGYESAEDMQSGELTDETPNDSEDETQPTREVRKTEEEKKTADEGEAAAKPSLSPVLEVREEGIREDGDATEKLLPPVTSPLLLHPYCKSADEANKTPKDEGAAAVESPPSRDLSAGSDDTDGEKKPEDGEAAARPQLCISIELSKSTDETKKPLDLKKPPPSSTPTTPITARQHSAGEN